MGMEFPAGEMPDTFGLPEYKVTKIMGEIVGDGHDVRLICGAERFQHMSWLYTVVASPEDLLMFARYCEKIACEAINANQLIKLVRAEVTH